MKKLALHLSVLATAVLGFASFGITPARAQTNTVLYVTASSNLSNTSPELFGTLNLATGQFTQIASPTPIFTGLTTGTDGTIYGTASNGNLYTLSAAGVPTRYGSVTAPTGGTFYGLAFSGGNLLAEVQTNSGLSLYRVTGGGGSITLVGTMQGTPFQPGSGTLAYGPNGSLYFDSGTSSATSGVALRTVNPSTGATTVVGTTLASPVLTLAATATTLYGIDTVSTSNLGVYTVDTATGTASQIATVSGLPSGYTLDDATFAPAAAVPEPSAWALLGLGTAGLFAVTLRRRAVRTA